MHVSTCTSAPWCLLSSDLPLRLTTTSAKVRSLYVGTNTRIAGMTRHVIGADRTGELHVPKDSHGPEEIHVSLVGIDFLEIVEPAVGR